MIFNKLALALATISASAVVDSTTADSIYGIGNATEAFSTLITAVDAAGLADTLSGNGTYTLFAPPNAAFDKLPAELVEKLLDPTWLPQLKDVLLHHVLPTEVRSTDLADGITATTVNGEDIVINLDPPRVNEVSNILIDDGLVDVEADNGVIHGVDSVLTPASISNDIVDIAAGNEVFSTLVAAVTAAGLVDALKADGPITVFAPTDDAFAALPEGTVESLLEPENIEDLKSILTYHVVAANAASSGLASGDVPTLNGKSVTIDVSEDGVKVNGASVVQADIIAKNGIIHVVDSVLLPPTDDHGHDEDGHSDDMMKDDTDASTDSMSSGAIKSLAAALGIVAAGFMSF